MTTVTITTLDELLAVCQAAPRPDAYDTESQFLSAAEQYAAAHGLPLHQGEIDWTSLPTFGGDEPRNTSGVWSWDAARLLVGDSLDNWRLVDRAEYDRA